MRLGRTLVATSVTAIALTSFPSGGASADSPDLPTAVDTVVHGDLESYQWMLPAVNAAEAHTEATGAGTTVAVIDTGVDSTHPDLENAVVPGAYLKRDKFTGKVQLVPASDVAKTSNDWYGHGSHVAGIIAGDDDGDGITGIAPDAAIMPIHLAPALGFNEVQFWGFVRQAIDFSAANGADVINMSLAGPSSGIVPSDKTQKYLDALDGVCDSVASARAAGTVVVVAAGNDGVYGNPEMVPGSCAGSFTVAALDPSLDRTFWSSYDAAVDISAPGQDILSVDSTVAQASDTPHLLASGTSMASPVVAGVAALVAEEHPAWTPQQIEDQITSTAKDLGVNGRDPEFGWGAADAAAAVGAPASAPSRQNFFATWFEKSVGAKNGEGVVSWTPPTSDPVTGYTVTVYDGASTATYSAGGDSVRADVLMPSRGWYTLTAHTTTGDVSTYPATSGRQAAGDRPSHLRQVKLERRGQDGLRIEWAKPDDPEKLDVIGALAFGERHLGTYDQIRVDQSGRFPDHMTMDLLRSMRWDDVTVVLFLTNKDEAGDRVGFATQRVKDISPAKYGSRIESIDRAGARMVEVTGGMSESHMKRVCGRDKCAGEHAVLAVDRRRRVERVTVTFTERGVFHQLVAIKKGSEALKLRVEGPKSLDSGPFVKFGIEPRRMAKPA